MNDSTYVGVISILTVAGIIIAPTNFQAVLITLLGIGFLELKRDK